MRNYGFRKLTPFIKSLGILDIRSVPVNDGNSRQVHWNRPFPASKGGDPLCEDLMTLAVAGGSAAGAMQDRPVERGERCIALIEAAPLSPPPAIARQPVGRLLGGETAPPAPPGWPNACRIGG